MYKKLNNREGLSERVMRSNIRKSAGAVNHANKVGNKRYHANEKS